MPDSPTPKPSLFDVVKSVAASAFGVQSSDNYQRDFEHGSVLSYIIVGVVFVTLLVVGLAWLVNWLI